jgi:hypothetical protein
MLEPSTRIRAEIALIATNKITAKINVSSTSIIKLGSPDRRSRNNPGSVMGFDLMSSTDSGAYQEKIQHYITGTQAGQGIMESSSVGVTAGHGIPGE